MRLTTYPAKTCCASLSYFLLKQHPWWNQRHVQPFLWWDLALSSTWRSWVGRACGWACGCTPTGIIKHKCVTQTCGLYNSLLRFDFFLLIVLQPVRQKTIIVGHEMWFFEKMDHRIHTDLEEFLVARTKTWRRGRPHGLIMYPCWRSHLMSACVAPLAKASATVRLCVAEKAGNMKCELNTKLQ